MPERRFPVLCSSLGVEERRVLDAAGLSWLTSVPWAFVTPHEEQIRRNHYQDLDELAKRGGLSARELLAALEGKNFEECASIRLTTVEAYVRLSRLLQAK